MRDETAGCITQENDLVAKGGREKGLGESTMMQRKNSNEKINVDNN